MQHYNLPAQQGYEDLITCPIMIDGQSVRKRLLEQRRAKIKQIRAQELSLKAFTLRWLRRLAIGLWACLAYPILIYALMCVRSFDFIEDRIIMLSKWARRKVKR